MHSSLRSRPDLASGATAGVQAAAASAQLSYSREYERDADRVGLQSLTAAGFDPRAMAGFFEKMQRAQRVSDDSTLPGYLRTHPINTERIAEAGKWRLAFAQLSNWPQTLVSPIERLMVLAPC